MSVCVPNCIFVYVYQVVLLYACMSSSFHNLVGYLPNLEQYFVSCPRFSDSVNH